MHGDHQQFYIREFLPDFFCCINAILNRHIDIENTNIGRRCFKHVENFLSIICFTYHLNVLKAPNDELHSINKHLVVVGDDDSYHIYGIGISMVTVQPLPGEESKKAVPFSWRTREL